MAKKMDKVRKKTEVIADNMDMTDKERNREIKNIYKKAGLISKKKVEVKYVVAKKGVRGRVTAKSKGIKGPYKVVDRRLKKDKQKMKQQSKRNPKRRKQK